MKKRHEQKLIILSILLLMAFNMPLLLLFDSAQPVLGIPVIYIYFFSVSLASVIISFYIIRRYYE
ncbi:MAG: hypothetical protein EOP46_19970 [Sphingobacteriaceae bacterium]|nr:MAG: hypothetical protein EOP46_19970 [Sphingobacteriaceae bacterium]